MRRRDVLRAGLAAGARAVLGATVAPGAEPVLSNDREHWVKMLETVAGPVLEALSAGRLRATMPVEAAPGLVDQRRRVTHLEAAARTLAGIAPWLETGPREGAEGTLRNRYSQMAREAVARGVDPASPDYLRFGIDRQTIVDAAFLALAVVRAPVELREKLPGGTRKHLADGLRATRELLAGFNNWLLFAAMIEACLFQLGEAWDRARVDYALREHQAWFLGDGTYGDGPQLHWDFYNSYVIQPFLLSLMDAVGDQEPAWAAMRDTIRERARRYAAVQERMIGVDGSYPALGRSITYRCGAFQLLAEVARRRDLPDGVLPEQVRGALTAVIRRTLGPGGTFDEGGWLRIGLVGHQPSLGENYISTGSLYLCTAVFLPLGLPAEDRFWSGMAADWTARKVWAGVDIRPG